MVGRVAQRRDPGTVCVMCNQDQPSLWQSVSDQRAQDVFQQIHQCDKLISNNILPFLGGERVRWRYSDLHCCHTSRGSWVQAPGQCMLKFVCLYI